MPTPRKRTPRTVPQPARRPKVAGQHTRAIRPTKQPHTEQPDTEQPDTDQVDTAREVEEHAESPVVEDAVAEDAVAEDAVAEDAVAEDVVVADLPGVEQTEPEPELEPAAEPELEPEPVPEPEAEDAAAEAESSNRDWLKLRLAAACVVLAAIFAGLAVWFAIAGSGGEQNIAVTDVQATKEVLDQVGKDLNAIMSYDYRDPGKTDRAAKAALGNDKLAGDYSDVINVLKEKGPNQQLAVQTKVVKGGVPELRGDRAIVLALASQNYTKGQGAQSQATSARLRVNAEFDGDRWRITHIEQY